MKKLISIISIFTLSTIALAAPTDYGLTPVTIRQGGNDAVIDSNGSASSIIKDAGGIPAEVDNSTHSMQTIEYSHHEIHAGSHYKAGFMNTDLDTDATVQLLFVTPNTTKWAHWTLTAQATGSAKIEVYEGTSVSANGTAVTRWNRNRNSTNTSTTLVYHTPTVTTSGTKMITKYIGSEGFRSNIGGEHRGDSEFMLLQNTKYLLVLTAISDDIVGSVGGDWYEHTDKD